MNKAVIITGAGSGIGAATALKFSKMGYFIYLLGRDKNKLEKVAESCRAGARRYACDLENFENISTVTKDILSHKDTQVEVLVNNAGQFQYHSFADGSLELWQKLFTINLFGTVALTQIICEQFKKQNSGSIVNVASTLGVRPTANTSAYSASKAALINLTQVLALELAQYKIRVNCVAPGIVATPIHGDKADFDSMSTYQPLGRVGSSEEIAESIYFLASDSSSWTTGATLNVDGGINL